MGIKLGNIDISAFKVGSDDCKVYLGDTLLYPTTPPVFEGKFKLTLSDSSTVSAECDASSAITGAEISAYTSTLVSAEIGDCVTIIRGSVFSGCTSLTNCTIGSGVTSIYTNAFRKCSGLTLIDIPDSVTSIGNSAFQDCSGLTNCTIGSGVTSIGKQEFANCTSLTSLTITATTPPTLGTLVFFNTSSNFVIYVPSGSAETYKSASGWSTYANRIQAIPNS